MTLTRVWTPTGNYSSGSAKRLIVLHTMEGFTGSNGAYDCAKYFQGDVGASSQVCIDNNRGKIWECVSRSYGAWTQCNYNSVSVSAEQSGYASWSRDYWLSNRENELRNTADWIREESQKFGIPIRALTSGEAQSGGKGVTQHMHLGSTGCGHSDCGSPYPIDKVIEWAKGGSSQPVEAQDMSASSVSIDGQLHMACIWEDGLVNYSPDGGDTWYYVDPDRNKVRSGADITVTPGGVLVITYTNSNGQVCTWQKGVNDPKSDWGWYGRNAHAKLCRETLKSGES